MAHSALLCRKTNHFGDYSEKSKFHKAIGLWVSVEIRVCQSLSFQTNSTCHLLSYWSCPMSPFNPDKHQRTLPQMTRQKQPWETSLGLSEAGLLCPLLNTHHPLENAATVPMTARTKDHSGLCFRTFKHTLLRAAFLHSAICGGISLLTPGV